MRCDVWVPGVGGSAGGGEGRWGVGLSGMSAYGGWAVVDFGGASAVLVCTGVPVFS